MRAQTPTPTTATARAGRVGGPAAAGGGDGPTAARGLSVPARPQPPTAKARSVDARPAQGVAACPVRAVRAPVAERVAAQWDRAIFAKVADRELQEACALLVDDQRRRGFAPERASITVLKELGPYGRLEVQLAPERKAYYEAEGAHGGGCDCPFCAPCDARQRALVWRDLKVFANPFPYTSDDAGHLVVSSAAHQLQHFSARFFEDLVDMQGLLDGPTLHYNGVAGNSQEHLHWHVTREKLPLERAMEDGFSAIPVRADPDAATFGFDDGEFTGLLVTGDRRGVARHAGRLVAFLEADEATRGAYNMLLLPPLDGRIRLVVIPRRADTVEFRLDPLGDVSLGAFDVAGRGVFADAAFPDDMVDAFVEARRRSVIPWRELPWLDDFQRAPTSGMLCMRLGAAAV